MTTLTKHEIIQEISLRIGLNKRESKDIVEHFFDHMKNVLVNGEEMKLSGFGNFNVRDKVARPGRNPKTKEPVIISARRVVTFHPGQKLRDKIVQHFQWDSTGKNDASEA